MPEEVAEHIDPWGQLSVSKYSHLYEEFGIKPIDDRMRAAFKDSPYFKRGLVIGHRDMEPIVADLEQGKKFLLVSGFAASGEFHFGHKAVIDIYRFFRQFAAHGYFAICDLDAYISRPNTVIPDLDTARAFAVDNVANAIALGVNPADIYLQSRQPAEYFTLSHSVSKQFTLNTLKSALGHTDLGKMSAAYLQIADILYPQIKHGPMRTVIPVGMDQEPIIRLTRDVARKLADQHGFILPASVYTTHVPSLVNMQKKMSKSVPGSAIMLNSTHDAIEHAVAGAMTGGRPTDEEQRRLGGIPDTCPVYSFYNFHHPNNQFVDDVHRRCLDGKLLCGEDKDLMRTFLREFSEEHMQKYRAALPEAQRIVGRSNSIR